MMNGAKDISNEKLDSRIHDLLTRIKDLEKNQDMKNSKDIDGVKYEMSAHKVICLNSEKSFFKIFTGADIEITSDNGIVCEIVERSNGCTVVSVIAGQSGNIYVNGNSVPVIHIENEKIQRRAYITTNAGSADTFYLELPVTYEEGQSIEIIFKPVKSGDYFGAAGKDSEFVCKLDGIVKIVPAYEGTITMDSGIGMYRYMNSNLGALKEKNLPPLTVFGINSRTGIKPAGSVKVYLININGKKYVPVQKKRTTSSTDIFFMCIETGDVLEWKKSGNGGIFISAGVLRHYADFLN